MNVFSRIKDRCDSDLNFIQQNSIEFRNEVLLETEKEIRNNFLTDRLNHLLDYTAINLFDCAGYEELKESHREWVRNYVINEMDKQLKLT